jgi:hypothetical protein
MKKFTILSALSLFTLFSCTKGDFISSNFELENYNGKTIKNNNGSTPDIPDKVDDNLLKVGAQIFVDITKQNDVTAVFEFPAPNCKETVTWWYEWQYIPEKGNGVKATKDKTLKFHAETNSNIILAIQCKKSNGVKSDVILTSAKVVINEKKKTIHINL